MSEATVSDIKIIRFTAYPAGYRCSEPGEQSGEYVQIALYDRLRAQNAELLEALRECERFCEFEGSPLGLSVAKIARSAIRAYEN
jgi:hypothetical protein